MGFGEAYAKVYWDVRVSDTGFAIRQVLQAFIVLGPLDRAVALRLKF
jgi:hypothetical protein